MSILLTFAITPYLTQDAFAVIPTITTFVADDPDDLDAVLSVDDRLFINFSGAGTNATVGGTITNAEIIANFTIQSGTFPTAMNGTWNTANQLEIQITDLTAGVLTLLSTTVTGHANTNIAGLAGLNADLINGVVSPTLTGDFGLFVAAVDDPITGGGGCKGDCTPPTLGVDKRGTRLVSNGFTYNEHAVDVERFFTPYPLITANIGEENKAEFKIYENQGVDNIKHFSLAFGLATGHIISESKAMIELAIDFDGTETVTVTDPENVLDNVRVQTSTVSCGDDIRVDCLGITVYHTFRAPLDFNIVATDVWDFKRNAWQNYFNHGINVIGDSLNPPDKHTVFDRQGFVYTITEIDKMNAIDEDGNKWYLDDNSFWKNTNYVKKSLPNEVPLAGYDRNHPYFTIYQNGQVVLAENTLKLILGTDSIQSILPDYIPAATSDRIDRSDDVELQTKLKLEEIRAFERMYKEYYGSNPYGKQFPFSEPEIPEGFGGIIPESDSQEQMMVIALVIGIIAVIVVIGIYYLKKNKSK